MNSGSSCSPYPKSKSAEIVRDRIYVLEKGQIQWTGPMADLAGDIKVQRRLLSAARIGVDVALGRGHRPRPRVTKTIREPLTTR